MRTFLENLPEVWPPEFLRLLQSNEPPTKILIMEIRQTVFAQAMQNLSELLHTWNILQRIIEDCKTVMAPIRQLPPEILLEIFRWTNADQAHVDIFSNRSVPWTLGQVCRQWRGLVQSDTGLWSNVLVRGFSHHRHPPREPLRLLEQALSLSNQQALSIRCVFDYDDLLVMEKERNALQEKWPNPDDLEEDIITTLNHQVLRLLVGQSRRWSNACFRIDDYSYLPILNDVKGKLDRLETLSFGMVPGWIENSAPVFDAFEVAPELRNVELSRMGRVMPLLPCQQLVSVRVEWYDRDVIEEHLAPLRSLPNLQEYDLDGFDYELRELNNREMIQHNTLRVLHVCTPGALTNLVLPNLEEIRLKAASFDEICRFATLNKLPGLIDRSGCSIRRLTLSDVMESDDLIPVLERTPNLNELHVELNHWQFEADEFIATVAKYLRVRKEDRQIPLPKLHTLTISVRGSPKWDVPFDLPMTFLKRKTAEMIRDRWNITGGLAADRLKFVRISVSVPSRYHIAPYDEFVMGLEELQKDGLNISLSIIGGHETLYES
ncbi:hypothetical protein DFS33DRAFT_1421443 [Desarmillaria ectypa]|nr:hypothetical protein DFS33DRAFT_1421443 [Desarmillaria ectypa]